MKNILYFSLLILAVALFAACEEKVVPETYDYHAHIKSPNAADKHVGDTIHVHVEFEEHSGKAVHHVNVQIYNKADNTVIYNQPTDAHVHAHSGVYDFHDDVILNVAGHTDWVLKATIWGEEAGEGEASETVEFHVHP